MTLFLPNIPQPNDNLDFSQGQLLSNNQGLDTLFGIDHYPFSDASANKGFHNKVTTPVVVNSPPDGLPPATVANPIFYAFQQLAAYGVLQYSRGPNNAVPTPLTHLQSPAAGIPLAPGGTTPVVNFAGSPGVIAKLFMADMSATPNTNSSTVVWNGAAIVTATSDTGSNLIPNISGTTLEIKNNGAALNSVVWVLDLLRVS